MILGGVYPEQGIEHTASKMQAISHAVLTLKVDTSRFVEQVTRMARQLTRIGFEREVQTLTLDQVDALMYVRGGFDPEFADEDTRDNYLRVIASHPRVGFVAAAAFLSGWVTHHPAAEPVDPFAWHRYFGSADGRGTEVRVNVA